LKAERLLDETEVRCWTQEVANSGEAGRKEQQEAGEGVGSEHMCAKLACAGEAVDLKVEERARGDMAKALTFGVIVPYS